MRMLHSFVSLKLRSPSSVPLKIPVESSPLHVVRLAFLNESKETERKTRLFCSTEEIFVSLREKILENKIVFCSLQSVIQGFGGKEYALFILWSHANAR